MSGPKDHDSQRRDIGCYAFVAAQKSIHFLHILGDFLTKLGMLSGLYGVESGLKAEMENQMENRLDLDRDKNAQKKPGNGFPISPFPDHFLAMFAPVKVGAGGFSIWFSNLFPISAFRPFSFHSVQARRDPNTKLHREPGEKRGNSTGANSKHSVETAPRNRRFLSLVVVKCSEHAMLNRIISNGLLLSCSSTGRHGKKSTRFTRAGVLYFGHFVGAPLETRQLSFRNARFFIILFVRNFWRVSNVG